MFSFLTVLTKVLIHKLSNRGDRQSPCRTPLPTFTELVKKGFEVIDR